MKDTGKIIGLAKNLLIIKLTRTNLGGVNLKPDYVDNLEEMEKFFDEKAKDWDEYAKHDPYNHYFKAISSHVSETKEKIRILELGCGTGLTLHSILDKAPNAIITCIDLSENMLEVLSKKFSEYSSQIQIRHGSFFEFPFGKEQFNYIISSQTFHHFTPNTKKALYEKIYLSLERGGKYIEGDFLVSIEEEKESLNEYYKYVAPLEEKEEGKYHFNIPLALETQKQLLSDSGFKWENDIYYEDETELAVYTGLKE